MTAASSRFRSVPEGDLDSLLVDKYNLDYSLSISMCDSSPLNFLRVLLVLIDHVMR